MNILVVNDDGIDARGIYELVKALSAEANVYVAAPHHQRSASGHSISIGKTIEIREVSFDNAKLAFEIEGTPADCTRLGLGILKDRGIKIDAVFSGINHGGNLGTDTYYSGTVGAAREGSFCGIPSVAVSVNDHAAIEFEAACQAAVNILRENIPTLDPNIVLNVNSPHLPPEQILGTLYTRLGPREYEEMFELCKSAALEGKMAYRYSGAPVVYDNKDLSIDVIAMQENYLSITPLRWENTDYEYLDCFEPSLKCAAI